MWSLLGSLISNFLLLRDLFGYAIPGAVMLAIADRYEHPNLSKVPLIFNSIWIKLVVAVTAAYVVGHVLAAIGYSFYEAIDFVRGYGKASEATKGMSADQAARQKAEEEKRVRESKVRPIYFRYLYPSMFIEADRRETLTILRVALSVALLCSAALPVDVPMNRRVIFAVAGLFMLWNGYKSWRVAQDYSSLTSKSGERAENNRIPVFHWGGSAVSDGSSSEDGKPTEPGATESTFSANGTLVVKRN